MVSIEKVCVCVQYLLSFRVKINSFYISYKLLVRLLERIIRKSSSAIKIRIFKERKDSKRERYNFFFFRTKYSKQFFDIEAGDRYQTT